MGTSRRALILAVAGFVVSGAPSQQAAASRPDLRAPRPKAAAAALQPAERDANLKVIAQLEWELAHSSAKIEKPWIRLAEVKRAAASLGGDCDARVAGIASALAGNPLREALGDAKALQAAGKLADALAVCDAATVYFENDLNGGANRRPRSPGPSAVDLFREIAAISDAVGEQIETPEFEALVTARDLLGPSERGLWEGGRSALFRFDKDLTILGAGDHARIKGVVAVVPPKSAPWHDFVLDLEFTLVSGDLELCLRCGPGRGGYRMRFGRSEGYELGKPHRLTISVKGSEVSLKPEGQPDKLRDRMIVEMGRTGGIGFALDPGAKAVISRLDLKVLR
jgi:hypothetical protein